MKEYMMSFEESQEYITKRGFDIPWNDCDVFVDERGMTRTIGNVLKWADENPSSRCYTKQQLRDMGFAFTTNGDIVTPDDMGNMAERFFEYRKKEWIEKACEWIKEHIDIPYEGRLIDGQPHVMDYIEWAEKRIEYANEIANSLRQYMEE